MRDYQVKRMFETIAFSYDFQNSFLSLRRDSYWRRRLAQCVKLRPGSFVLDVASGTAEVAIQICRQHKGVQVIGVDFSRRMLAIGQKKIRSKGLARRIHLSMGDARRLPVKSACIDALTISFGIRNIEERGQALAEFRRVLKPGGQLLIMEFDVPEDRFLGGIYHLYFDYILPLAGNMLARSNYAYTYLAGSVHNFPKENEFSQEIGQAGFSRLEVRKLTYGIARIFSGVKEETTS
ncbi:MAG: bifunctional demethylmenaquinone methyltransferase/2-methoxy-6-polyprenyl-1,4-benzoquinol methylase UbiE [Syntrophobacteria bacterium]